MINNKNQFKNALKEGKIKEIKRVYNLDEVNKINVGEVATIEQVQSNAFTLRWSSLDKPTWTYFDNIEVKDNKYMYYGYIDDFDMNKAEMLKEHYENLGVEVLDVSDDDKINKNRCSNYKYIYKFVTMINEIIEK